MHFKGQKAMGTNALFNHKTHTWFRARLRRELRLPEANAVRFVLRDCCKWGWSWAFTQPCLCLGEAGRSKSWRRQAALNKNELHFSQQQWSRVENGGERLAYKNKTIIQNRQERLLRTGAIHTFLWLHDKILIPFNGALLAAASFYYSLCISSSCSLRVRSISYLTNTGSALITLSQS